MAMINTTTRAQQPSVSGERKIKEKKNLFFFCSQKVNSKREWNIYLMKLRYLNPPFLSPL